MRTFAKGMRSQPTSAEDRMWRLLRARRFQGYKFRRQVPIGNYIVDFVCQSARLIVELDGSQHADDPSDVRRDNWLTGKGYCVLRVWNNELTANEAGVMTTIWSALQEQTR